MTPTLWLPSCPLSSCFHPCPQSAPHTARGNMQTIQGPLFFLPNPLRIKCKVFANTLPAQHKYHSQPIPLGTHVSNSSSNTTHIPSQGLWASCSLCLKQPFPRTDPKTDSISVQDTAQKSPPQKGRLWLNSSPSPSIYFLCLSPAWLPHNVLTSLSAHPPSRVRAPGAGEFLSFPPLYPSS